MDNENKIIASETEVKEETALNAAAETAETVDVEPVPGENEAVKDEPKSHRSTKWFVSVFAIMLLVFFIPMITVGIVVFALPPVYDNTFIGELGEKYDRLNSIDEPKIVIVGGSSVAFGIDSELMEEKLGMKVVNFGLYANLGTKLMLDLSKIASIFLISSRSKEHLHQRSVTASIVRSSNCGMSPTKSYTAVLIPVTMDCGGRSSKRRSTVRVRSSPNCSRSARSASGTPSV